MRIVFFGTPVFAETILKDLSAQHDIVAVVSQPDKLSGRGHKLTAPPVKVFAEKAGLLVIQPTSVRSEEFLEKIVDFGADINVVAAYGKILPESVLYAPKYGSINVHASLLPKYRGAAPIARAIMDGADTTGVTIMRMDAGLDTGDMILARSIKIDPNDTCKTLTEKLTVLGSVALASALTDIENGVATFVPQNDADATYASKILPEDCIINWNMSAEAICRQVRGLNPAPGAYTFLKGEKIKIWQADPIQIELNIAPGEIIAEIPKEIANGLIQNIGITSKLLVGSGYGLVSLQVIQAAGGKPMPIDNYLRGHKTPVGERFGV